MIPILFSENEVAFTGNGLCRLKDAKGCLVTEERNGQYELVLQYPVDGDHASEIAVGRYIYATHDEGKVPQAFQIYRIDTPVQGYITVNAWHISYALNNIIVEPFSAGSCVAALSGISTNSMNTNPFTFWTDKSVTADFNLDVPKNVRAVLGGGAGSILDVYGKGDYEFDMFTVKLHLNRGQNRGVSIRYGKNLLSLDYQVDASNVFNAVVPFWTDGEDVVFVDHFVVRTGETMEKATVLDLSLSIVEKPTVAELESLAQAFVDEAPNFQVKENIKVDFVALWQTEEYKNFAALQRVFLCDTVNIFYEKLGVNATAQVIKVVYDTLNERYSYMELGEPKVSLAQQIQANITPAIMSNVPSKSSVQAAVDHATDLITGGAGGYIKYHYAGDGTPTEMLVMDSADESTAVNIIRLNKNGIGFSNDGGATYTSAWTIDGNFVADFITTGTLNANLLTAGMIQDSSGENYWNLDTGEFVTKQGEIADFIIESDKLINGEIGVHKYGTRLQAGSFAMSNWKPYHIGGGVYENYTTLMNHNHGGMQFTFTKDADGTSKILGGIDTDVTVINGDIFPFLQFGSSSANMSVYTADYVGSRLIFHGTANFVNNVTLSSSAVLRANGGITGGAMNYPANIDMYGSINLTKTTGVDGNITAGGNISSSGNIEALGAVKSAGRPIAGSNGRYPGLYYADHSSSGFGKYLAFEYIDKGLNNDNRASQARWGIDVYSNNSSTYEILDYYETYQLPRVDANRSAHGVYDIITSKTPPPIIVSSGILENAGSVNYSMTGGRVYLVIVGRYSSGGTVATVGAYLIITKATIATNGALVAPLLSSNAATVSASGATLTITTSQTYMRYRIIDLG